MMARREASGNEIVLRNHSVMRADGVYRSRKR